MTAFAEYRFCPWDGKSLPVDHVCVAGAPRHAGRGAASTNGENVNSQLIEVPLTQASVKFLTDRLNRVEKDAADVRAERRRMLAEADSMELVLRDLEEIAARYRARLAGAVSLLPPDRVDLADDPEDELPLEAQAHQAALAEQTRRDPYGPATVPSLPRFTDRVHVEGVHLSEPYPGGAL